MRTRNIALATAVLAVSAATALAQAPAPPPPPPPGPLLVPGISWTGFYAGANAGAAFGAFPGTITVGPTPATPGVPGTPAPGGAVGLRSGYSNGITGGGQAGFNWQTGNWLLGAEGDFKGDGLSRSTGLAGPPTQTLPFPFVPGDSFTARQNWDASIRGRLGFVWNGALLYATGGYAFSEVKLSTAFITTGIFPSSIASQTKTLSGPTVGGGVEFWITPQLSLGAEYRYTDYGSSTYSLGKLSTFAGAGPTFAFAPVSGRVGLREDAVLAKINFHFNVPPPPPPAPMAMPAPPPAAPKVFIVFFDWDKDVITPEGQQIIQQAADAYKSGAPVQLQVTGYTDRSGSPGYNQRLSERRANNVAKALAALGVPREQMAVSGRGENDNRVPTADGVREPQNRRVEIVSP
jgi:opacity protein-like surface antigen